MNPLSDMGSLRWANIFLKLGPNFYWTSIKYTDFSIFWEPVHFVIGATLFLNYYLKVLEKEF
jgi:hypothetical protein